jgi:hypothetical protein
MHSGAGDVNQLLVACDSADALESATLLQDDRE